MLPDGTSRLRHAMVAVVGLVLFLVAVRVLGTAADAMTPALRRLLPVLLDGPAAALGIGWTATYVLVNGSVVAALAVTLAASGVLGAVDTFLMISGSRLGASAFVILIGFLDYWRAGRRQTVRDALGLGLLTFVVTHTVYLPATALGMVGTARLGEQLGRAVGSLEVPVASFEFVRPAVDQLIRLGGSLPVFLVALGLLFVAVRLADRAVRAMDEEELRSRYLSRLERPWLSFTLGLLFTVGTASIAFSVGVAVPLYNRGYLSRKQVVPYVLGANLGTLADTFLVGMVLESPVGAATVLALFLSAAAVTLLALAVFRRYLALVEGILDAVVGSRRAFVLVALSLLLAPLLLTAWPLVG